MTSTVHLVRRFVGSLWPGGPPAAGERWVGEVLSEAELVLWRAMSGPDRRHAVGVARTVERDLGSVTTAPVLAAALLHDVGKVQSGLGTFGRVVATVAIRTGRADVRPSIARYGEHARLGAEMLELAGSDPLTVTWARDHHLPSDQWSLDPVVAAAL
ncbi:MAG: hypothetical protein QOF84_7161, partial [Streptomyces sp.]|nr:hypothetical protein [Streptomyces sp.]